MLRFSNSGVYTIEALKLLTTSEGKYVQDIE